MRNFKNIHKWDVLAISCLDGRFITRTIDWVSGQTNGLFDFRTEVGSSKAIIDSNDDRARLFSLIETSKRLHDIKEVWLIDHIDCGAYGGSKEFETEEEEREFHSNKLEEASKVIAEQFPDLAVKKIYADWDKFSVIR